MSGLDHASVFQAIEKRRLECEQMLNDTTSFIEGVFCAGVFDAWTCWPDTPANVTAHAPCPSFVEGFDENRTAFRYCDEDGSWFRHPITNRSWSNYSTCVDYEDLYWRQMMITTYEVGYSTSLVALVISFSLLAYFRSLRCARITLHMNLFVSFALNNALWLIWYRFVTRDPKVIYANEVWCQVLHVVLHYFLLTNYTWMLCEGFYLHTVLITAFVSESKLLHTVYALGWGAPAIAIIVYTAARVSDREDCRQCWMNDSPYRAVLIVPGCAAMFLNVVFLCNIVRVLLVKLRAGPHVQGNSGPSSAAIQAFRATLLLVPLLGLHYFLTPFRPPPKHPWERAYEIVSAVSASFQGLCVATLFCFCNGEVVAQVRRKWRALMFRPRANSCTATTVSQYFRSTAGPAAGEERV